MEVAGIKKSLLETLNITPSTLHLLP